MDHRGPQWRADLASARRPGDRSGFLLAAWNDGNTAARGFLIGERQSAINIVSAQVGYEFRS